MPGHRVSALRSRLGRERGGVLVIVAVFMAVAIGIATLVVDVGHWFEHKRHLQGQVDAGAFAGAALFNGCVAASASDRSNAGSAANAAISNEARKYAGDTQTNPSALNAQVNNKANVTVLLNSTKFPNQGGANYDDPNGPPCQSGYVDLKSTDANVPWFLGANVVPAIDAHARVATQTVTTLAGSLPVAVQDVNPVDAAAIFIDESNANAVLATTKLNKKATPSTLNGRVVNEWDSSALSPPSVTIPSGDPNIGVVIALSGTASWSLTGSLATVCGQDFVDCYAADPTTGAVTGGLLFVHGYTTSGTGTAAVPILRDVTTPPATCTDGSAPSFVLNSGCTVNVRAKVDFGTATGTALKVAPAAWNTCPNGGSAPKGCAMTFNSGTGYWQTNVPLSIPAGSGPLAVDLNWGTSSSNGTFSQVSRPFSASAASGPIVYAQVSEAAAAVQSLTYGTHTLNVAVGVTGSLGVASSASDPTVILRFASGNGSNSGALDCDVGVNLATEIQRGCTTAYSLNTGQACTAANTPPYCVASQTGDATGQLSSGMNARFAGCPVNRWVPSGSGLPTIPDGDPRMIPLIITSFGAFGKSGTTRVPVLNFGAFYVTGWDQGTAGTPPCSETGAPANELFPDCAPKGPIDCSKAINLAKAEKGDIWGHFMTYVGSFGGSTTGGSTCNFAGFSLCTTVLTE